MSEAKRIWSRVSGAVTVRQGIKFARDHGSEALYGSGLAGHLRNALKCLDIEHHALVDIIKQTHAFIASPVIDNVLAGVYSPRPSINTSVNYDIYVPESLSGDIIKFFIGKGRYRIAKYRERVWNNDDPVLPIPYLFDGDVGSSTVLESPSGIELRVIEARSIHSQTPMLSVISEYGKGAGAPVIAVDVPASPDEYFTFRASGVLLRTASVIAVERKFHL
ncbi:hypothetical protein SISSUDRAFT_1065224 [Sistotremastrum suecicum HHB10207 ss-3]|uniref:Uncharacterized protein n=1 Tax=Sistotremastrum suecicum HHB10207 ss-3 TaxID=1314776 RepID=A0A165ZQK4_9AGAM|nr:hypothetical protein SISSUDRAFT_1065224 [Sistotremastrum suecicum HHB10207 ss-3]